MSRAPRWHRATVAACQPLEFRRLLAAGDPDLTFSGDGVATLDQFPGGPINAYDVALQLDGKVVVAGYQQPKGLYCAARLNVDGSIDTTFGNGGVWTFPRDIVGSGGQPQVAIQGDGKIIIVGPKFDGTDPVYAVARLTADGQPDLGFGSGGFVHTDVGFGGPTDVTIQQDGKIVVVGTVRIGGDFDFAVVRYHTSGVNEFVRTFGFGGDDGPNAVAIDYTGTPVTNPRYGSIIVVGDRDNDDFAVARLTPAGQLDSTFDGDGKLTTSFPGREIQGAGVVIQPGGKIVAVGSSLSGLNFDVAMARYLPSGALDTSFGTDGTGRVEDDFGGNERPTNAATGFLGGILVCAISGQLGTVIAYTADGRIDTRYGGDGVVQTNVSLWLGIATSGDTIAPIRRLVLAGDQHVARYVDVGSVVAVGSFDPNATEGTPTTDVATFIVGRTERLPFAERVYFSLGGTARPPTLLNADYLGSNITFVQPLQGRTYVEIPANETVTTVTISPIDDTLVEGDESAVFTISGDLSYDIGTPPSTTLAIRDNDDAGGPTVAAAQFLFATAPQRVSFRFSQNVLGSIGADDFHVTGPAGTPSFDFSYDEITNTATLRFTELLPDGEYTARAIASGIWNDAFQPMPADHVLDFFFLMGDADHDGRVNLNDFNILAANFGQTPRDFTQGDFTYDGRVNLADFNVLASRFGVALAPSAPIARPGVVTPSAEDHFAEDDLLRLLA